MKKLTLFFFVTCFCMCTQLFAQEAKILYKPDSLMPQPGAMYPRVIRLKNYQKDKGALLATFEQYVNGEPCFPIYRSIDNGKTWSLFSKIMDTKNHWGMRYQPQLFELPQQTGDMPAGTVLCAGSSIPADMSVTQLQLYKSLDGGKSWQFVSTIITGGGAGPTIPLSTDSIENHDKKGKVNNPVWEPFLALDKSGKLLCFYSDERYKDKCYNQLLAHFVSGDGGKTWSQPVFDVAVPDSVKRPGMIVTAQLPNGKYIMVYEVVNVEHYPVFCRFSDDGDNWGNPADLGTKIIDSSNGYFMSGTPYIIWVPAGGPNGTLVVSAKGTIKNGEIIGGGLMINKNLGKGSWQYKETIVHYDAKKHSGGYSRSMIGIDGGKKILMLTPVPQKENMSSLYCTFEDVLK